MVKIPSYQSIILRILLSLVTLGVVPLRAYAAPRVRSGDFTAIDAYVTAQMHNMHIPGIALGIVHGDQIVHLQGFGIANPAGPSIAN